MSIPYKTLDMNEYSRREHFQYFNSMANPYVGVTCNVDITRFLSRLDDKGYPFFLSFVWCATRAANDVRELRQRILDGGIIEFERCTASCTTDKGDGTYCYCSLECDMPLSRFIPAAKEAQSRARLLGTIKEDAGDALCQFFVSSLPWLSYTALVQPTPGVADSNPRITWGKHFEQNGRRLIPVTLMCNHALVDGRQLAEFYKNLELHLGLESDL